MANYKKTCLYLMSLCLTFYSCNSELTLKYITLYNKEGKLMKKEDLHKDSVNVLKPIIFVINGLDSSDNAWVNALVEEYLEKQIHNVFLLDLEDREEQEKNSDVVSSEVTDFINEIYNKTGEQYLHWRLIGITGPGFDIAVDVGRKFSNNSNRKIDRITALEPTYYLGGKKPKDIPESHDETANLVDVVHSNIRKFGSELKHYGHVDFYIFDANCKEENDLQCGRLNAIKMFKRSVNSENLTAVKCPSLEDYENEKCKTNSRVLFGENMPNNADGIYILKYQ